MDTDRKVVLGDGTIVSFLNVRGTCYIDNHVVSKEVQEQYYLALQKSHRFLGSYKLVTRDDYVTLMDYWEKKYLTGYYRVFMSIEEIQTYKANCRHVKSVINDAMLANLDYNRS